MECPAITLFADVSSNNNYNSDNLLLFLFNFFLFLIYFRYATRKDGGAVRKIPHYKKKKKLKTRNSENNARFENVERMIY